MTREGSALAAAIPAVGSGRTVAELARGAPVLYICFGQETQNGWEPVEAVARELYPRASQLFVAHLIDLHKIPGLLRKVAESVLAGEHRKAVEALAPGINPERYAVMLPDWDGSAIRALGLDDATRTLGVVLTDTHGTVVWSHQDVDPAAALRARLAAHPL